MHPNEVIGEYNYINITPEIENFGMFAIHFSLAEESGWKIVIPHFTGVITANLYLGATYSVKIDMRLDAINHRIGVRTVRINGWTYEQVYIDALYGLKGGAVIMQ